MTTTIDNLGNQNYSYAKINRKFHFTLKAGTGRRIVECESLAMY
jgi:hypothetical protein